MPTEGSFVRSDLVEVHTVARGIATAVANAGRLSEMQGRCCTRSPSALTDVDVDYRDLEPLGPDALATALAARDSEYRHRIVHHMVLAELVLLPLPDEVAARVELYTAALGIDDHEIRARLHLPPKGTAAIAAGSPGVREPEGMSESQRATYEVGDWDATR